MKKFSILSGSILTIANLSLCLIMGIQSTYVFIILTYVTLALFIFFNINIKKKQQTQSFNMMTDYRRNFECIIIGDADYKENSKEENTYSCVWSKRSLQASYHILRARHSLLQENQTRNIIINYKKINGFLASDTLYYHPITIKGLNLGTLQRLNKIPLIAILYSYIFNFFYNTNEDENKLKKQINGFCKERSINVKINKF